MRASRALVPVLTAIGSAILAIAFSTSSSGQGKGPPGGMPPTQVEVAKPTVTALADTISGVGTLRAAESITVRPEQAGLIESVHFSEGQKVANGAPLFRLDAALVRADVAEAEANAANSDRESKRAQEMVARKLISQSDVDNRRAQAKVDAARLDSTRTHLSKTQIHAPFAGVVGLRKVSPGEYVKVGDALVDLVQVDPLKVDFNVPEAYVDRAKPGMKIHVTLDAFPGKEFVGEVYAVAPQIDLNTRSLSLRAKLPNPDSVLKPGQFARIALELSHKDSALMIPEQALWPQGEKKFVYIIKSGKAEMREVTTGLRKPGMVEVLTGLTADDVVITAGQMKIGPGSDVQPAGAAPAAATIKAGDHG
jgi:membrane fusion protein, multidrug efflux system